MMSNAVRQIYLTSLWRYDIDGVQRLIRELGSYAHIKAEVLYESQWNFFKVTCSETEVETIANIFAKIEEHLEAGMPGYDDVDQILECTACSTGQPVEDPLSRMYHQEDVPDDLPGFTCPPEFLNFPFARTWSALDQEKLTIHALLDTHALQELAQHSGVHLSYDLTGKIVYIGGAMQSMIDDAARRLDAILMYALIPPLHDQHLLYAEDHSDFTTDARSMRDISRSLLSTTLLDPAIGSPTAQYQQLAEGGVSFRICLPHRNGEHHISLFGPSSSALHDNDPMNRICSDFRTWRYPAKQRQTPPATSALLRTLDEPADPVAAWVQTQELGETGQRGARTLREDAAPVLVERRMATPEPVDLLGAFQPNPFMERSNESQPQPGPCLQSPNCAGGPDHCWKGGLAPWAAIKFDMAPLIPLHVNQRKPLTAQLALNRESEGAPLNQQKTSDENVSRKQAVRRGKRDDLGSPVSLLQQRLGKADPNQEFVKEFSMLLRKVLDRGRASKSKIALTVDFGRICSWGWDHSALANNKPEQPSNGYRRQHLLETLNKKLYTRGGLLFTKILSTHGGDADYLASLSEPGLSLPIWERVTRRVVYAFTCEDLKIIASADMGPSRFVVEVTRSSKATYGFSVRKACNRIGNFFIHGICRNWDLQVALTAETDPTLEREHAAFAQALLASICIPDGTVRKPSLEYDVDDHCGVKVVRLRALHIARYRSKDGATFFDLKQVQDLTTKDQADVKPTSATAGKTVSRFHATPVNEKPRKGVYASWIEASISSAAAEQAFAENGDISLGDEVTWTSEKLEKAGVFSSLLLPSIAMLKRMDSVGHHNNNGLGHKEKPHDTQVQCTGESWAGFSYW